MTFSYLLFSFTLHLMTFAADDWCYDIQTKVNAGCKVPSMWDNIHENCAKKKQSPVDIVTCKAEFNSNLTPFKFQGYDKENKFILQNNGHTALLTLVDDGAIKITGGGLSGTYNAKQLHFHWGNKHKSGSEHYLNGVQYPIELHIVHENEERLDLAVLGFFYQKEDSINKNYENLITEFARIELPDNKINFTIKLQDLIPKADHLKLFYRYEGSLTTPACDETVTWTVFPKTIGLGETQIADFYTKLKYRHDQQMAENFRPIQSLNDRIIFTSGVDAKLPHTRYLLITLFVFYLTSVS